MSANPREVCEMDCQEFLSGAARFYRFLSGAFFKELTEEQIARLAGIGLSYEDDGSKLAEGFKGMRIALARRGDNARQDFAVDYARIFLAAGTYDGETAVPYESVFTSPEGILMQASRDQVVRLYREYGFCVDPALNMPEDHLAFELEFVALLCDQAAEALAAEDVCSAGRLEHGGAAAPVLEALCGFIGTHILNWLPRLLERVEAFARLRFYPAITLVTLGYLEETVRILNELLAGRPAEDSRAAHSAA